MPVGSGASANAQQGAAALEAPQAQASRPASGGLDPSLGSPEEYLCPISQDLMRDPVVTPTGQTFERAAIERWLAGGHTRCPTTGIEMRPPVVLHPNYNLRLDIQLWAVQHGVSLEEDPSAANIWQPAGMTLPPHDRFSAASISSITPIGPSVDAPSLAQPAMPASEPIRAGLHPTCTGCWVLFLLMWIGIPAVVAGGFVWTLVLRPHGVLAAVIVLLVSAAIPCIGMFPWGKLLAGAPLELGYVCREGWHLWYFWWMFCACILSVIATFFWRG